jgi:hypothetical protein
MRRLSRTHLDRLPLILFLMMMIMLTGVTSCAFNTATPLPTAQPSDATQAATPASPISPVSAPVSPPALPTTKTQPTLPAKLTQPLAEYTINNGMRADFVHLPFYALLTWTGITWDGGDYIWIINNELKAIAGFNIVAGVSDRLVAFPSDVAETPSMTGLTWDGSNFWVSDVRNKMIYQIEPLSGKRGDSFSYDGTPNGLDWANDSLWVMSKDRSAIEQVTPTGERQSSLPVESTWPSGLAWDGEYFWFSDAHEGTISILNPRSGRSKKLDEIKFLANPGTFNGLAWMNGYLWIATEGDERLHRFDVSQLDWEALKADLQ